MSSISALEFYIMSALSDEKVAISQLRENCKSRWNMTDEEIDIILKWLQVRIDEIKKKENQ